MNTESLSNHSPPKKDYQQLQKILKGRCEEISKDNDALSSRLINLKLLIYKSENQCKKLKDRLEYHGVDYHTAAAAAAAASNYAEATDFISEKKIMLNPDPNISGRNETNQAITRKVQQYLPITTQTL
ncbi:uncharacterized protein LOC124190305 isoform X2 [Daphnia pulex]|uniref:uncharacterized protein LOC124190305 isoform X2 n=1 Tax=Daphnia pulex TaxID=6669 RepID=UPI001EDEACE8|nr:uncharacterized protein LOC124190305 isoform X2 [Daphnia pulex]